MRPAVATLVIGILLVDPRHSVQGQAGPSAQPTPGPNEQSVVVEGCLNGKRFKPDMSLATMATLFGTLHVTELRLEGEPGLIKTIRKQHKDHEDEISGVVILPTNSDARVQGKKIGKRTTVTTVVQGQSTDPRTATIPRAGAIPEREQASTSTLPHQTWLRMKVTSLRHISNTCSF